jgi:hypothetical protein
VFRRVTTWPAPRLPPPAATAPKPLDWRALLLRLTGVDAARCPVCGAAFYSPALLRPAPCGPGGDTSRCRTEFARLFLPTAHKVPRHSQSAVLAAGSKLANPGALGYAI